MRCNLFYYIIHNPYKKISGVKFVQKLGKEFKLNNILV